MSAEQYKVIACPTIDARLNVDSNYFDIDNVGSLFIKSYGVLATIPVTNTLYVDGSRIDSYTELGSILYPYKTIMGAINKVISNADNTWTYQYQIKISEGNYAENIILEDTHLYALTFEGVGFRQTNIVPSTGNALQSTINNDNLAWLTFRNIAFSKSVNLTGENTNTWLGYNMFFFDCWFPVGDILFKNISYPFIIGGTKFSCTTVKFSNVTQAYIGSDAEIGSAVSTLTLETDQTGGVKTPNGWTTGTKIIIQSALSSKDLTWSLVNISTWTGSALQLRGARFGSSGHTIPTGATVLCYNSVLVGSYVVTGTLTMYNSNITGTKSGAGTITDEIKHIGSKIGFFNTSPVVKTVVSDQSAWADVTTGADTVSLIDLNTKVKAVRDSLQGVIDALQSYGII